jgi:hypothetical protein
MARITLTEETTAKEEKSIMYATHEMANPRTTDSTEMDTKAPSGVLVHTRGGSGMDCRAWIILFFPGLPRCMRCGSGVVWF